ncbi:hypothetical protein J1614_008185 [Plenodomus biglobosus]|nr:hypothetical protein J1614_008185 [Plenodomus biglobosus]
MDRASQALALGVPHGVPNSFRALADHHGVPRTTLQHRKRKRQSIEEKAQSQQYLYPWEEKALAKLIIRQDALGRPVRIKYIGSIAFSLARRGEPVNWPSKPPGKNWPQLFYKRHPELKPSIASALDWNRYHIFDKVIHWFEVIEEVLQDPAVLQENVYNMTTSEAIEVPVSSEQQSRLSNSLQWLKLVFHPQTEQRANQKPRVLICDGFGTHEILEIVEFCFENNIILCRLPSHTSHKLQPCDISVFSPLKVAYREQVERLERGCVGTIGKQHFTYLYSPARDQAFTSRNIRAGWSRAGLFPFNPAKVLSDIPKPLAGLSAPAPNDMERDSCMQDQVPQTPGTPITSNAVASLHNPIKQDTHVIDEPSRKRL